MAEQIVHADIRFAGSIGFNKNFTDFPQNPRPQTIIVKGGIPYIYADMGSGFHSWFPMATKQSAFIHSQGIPAEEWVINHNLDSVNYGLFAYDETHTLIVANHEPLNGNTVKAYFASAVMGSAVIFAVESFASSSITSTELVIGTLTVTDDGQGNLNANGNDLAYKQFVLDGLSLKANTADVAASIAAVIDAAPEALNTLREIALEMQADESAAGALTALVATKASSADLVSEVSARTASGIALQGELDSLAVVAHSGSYADLSNKPAHALTAAQWSVNHTLADGTRYLINDVVYDNGNIYKALHENESIPTSDAVYWELVGVGSRINLDGRDVLNVQFPQLKALPTTLAGYGITDSITAAATQAAIAVETNRATGVETSIMDAMGLVQASATTDLAGLDARATVLEIGAVNEVVERQAADALLAPQVTTYTKIETDARIQTVVGAAPAALDTLVEIATQLAYDESAAAALVNTVSTKVDKVTGKGLSTEDYTTAEKAKLTAVTGTNTGDETLATIKTKLGVNTLSGVNTGDQVLPTTLPASDVSAWAKTATKPAYTATEVGLGSVDNTTDATKPVSTAQAAAIALKADVATTYTKTQVDTAIAGATPSFSTLTGKPTTLSGFGVTDAMTAIAIAAAIAVESTRATTAEGLKASQANTYTKTETDSAIQAVVGAAPEALNTLAEIATQLASDQSAAAALVNTVATKVDKVTGKGLSTEDYTTAEKTKLATVTGTNTGDETLATIKTKLGVTTLSGVNTGDQVIPTTLPASDVSAWAKAATKPAYTATEVGLNNVNNTTDATKPVSTAQATAIALKADQAITYTKIEVDAAISAAITVFAATLYV